MADRATWRTLCIGLSCLGWILPTSILEAAPPPATAIRPEAPPAPPRPQPRVGDVALDAAGCLLGRVIDRQGLPVADRPVALGRMGRPIARSRTDASGRFRVGPLRGGTYHVSVGGRGVLVRAWVARTAPPAARDVALVVVGGDVVRGQMPLEEFFASDAVVVCGMVAAVIAIPIALNSSHSGPCSP